MRTMSQLAGNRTLPLSGAPQTARPAYPARTVRAKLRAVRLGDRYFTFLCLVLFGYALAGRGFAYLGVNPLFIGEIALVVGVPVLLRSGALGKLLSMNNFLPLLLFMAWGVFCTVPYLGIYGKESLRDAVVWGYAAYAFVVAGLLVASPQRMIKLIAYYRKFVYLFLIFAPITWAIYNFMGSKLPTFPGTGVPVIQVKGGDMCVHLAGVFSYVVALGAGINWAVPTLLIPLNLGLNVQGRAGMMAFFSACGFSMLLRPFHPRAMRIFFIIGVGMFFLWATDFKMEHNAREISFRGLITGLESIFRETAADEYHGSKEWRLMWWKDIYDYTVRGEYFWTGKGFGVNLATQDGYQVDDAESLRSPHNGHLTMLARTGVPGLLIWALVQGSWLLVIVQNYLLARKRRRGNWSGVFMFLGMYWTAFMANATFDVFIEGPMGGIWLWCIYGAGLGAAYLHKHYPDLLTFPPQPAPTTIPRAAQTANW